MTTPRPDALLAEHPPEPGSAVSFRVRGTPAPQGSKRAFVNRHTGRVALVESAKEGVREWRTDVRAAALEAFPVPRSGPVSLSVTFLFARPKGHLRADGSVRDSAPLAKVTRPDLDKVLRATLDALTGVVFEDDAQVVGIHADKVFVNRPDREQPGALIRVYDAR